MLRTALNKAGTATGFVVKVAVFTHCTFEYLFEFVLCSGPSMEPTLYSENILFTDRFSVKMGKINRGDIVIAKNPEKPLQLICKRVIGTEGDVIRAQVKAADLLAGDEFPFDDRLLMEAFDEQQHIERVESDKMQNLSQNSYKFKDVVIPRGHVWVEGDNTSNSSDSRHYGPIPRGLILSRVVFRLFPFNSIGFIS